MTNETITALEAEKQAAAIDAADPVTTVEELPAASLEDLEDLDFGTITQGERPGFKIIDDGLADWAVRKISEERAEYERLRDLGEQQIAAIQAKLDAAKRRYENGTAFLTSCLSRYFETVPHKKTKTTEKYRLISGTLTLKKGGLKATPDNEKLVPWLRSNGLEAFVKVKEEAAWGELKKKLSFVGDVAIVEETGEVVDGVTVTEAPDVFKVED